MAYLCNLYMITWVAYHVVAYNIQPLSEQAEVTPNPKSRRRFDIYIYLYIYRLLRMHVRSKSRKAFVGKYCDRDHLLNCSNIIQTLKPRYNNAPWSQSVRAR